MNVCVTAEVETDVDLSLNLTCAHCGEDLNFDEDSCGTELNLEVEPCQCQVKKLKAELNEERQMLVMLSRQLKEAKGNLLPLLRTASTMQTLLTTLDAIVGEEE